jgi:hypothetical protein
VKGEFMVEKKQQMEVFFLPSTAGLIKIYINGFKPYDSRGQVNAILNDVTISIKGHHRKKTVVRALASLHESLLNKNRD